MVEPVPKPHFGDWLSALMQPELHPLYRRWRRVADEYPGDRMYVGEIVIESQEKIASYVGPDELHLSFNFALLYAPWDAEHMRETIDRTLARARRGRRSRDLGVREPRRPPAADTLRRRRGRATAGAGCGPAALRPAGNLVHLPGPGARPRGGRSPGRSSGRTRSSSTRTAPGRGATAAACRSRGRRSRRHSGSPTASPGCRCHRTGVRSASRPRRAARTRCSSCSARRCGCGRATTASRGVRARPGRWSSSAAISFAPSTSTATRCSCPEGEILLASEPGITTALPPNTAAWIKRGAGQ